MGEARRKQVQGLVLGHPWPVSWAQALVPKASADPTAATTADRAELNESEMSRGKSRHSYTQSHSL